MTSREPTVITRTITRVVFPLIILVAIAFLLQGHNRPGGGFIAGVLTAIAFVLVYIVFGSEFVQTALFARDRSLTTIVRPPVVADYRQAFAVGLLLAAGSGLIAVLFREPFLSQTIFHASHLPIYGEFEFASAFVFDLGVYLTVLGALLTILGVVGSE